ncbi:MAG: small conductance mechanosensitive channel [Paraglaciecola sp.]|jgi:small conductance mechanosensitive channel
MEILKEIEVYYTDNYLIANLIGTILITFVTGYLTDRFFKRLIRKASEEGNSKLTNYQFLRRFVVTLVYIIGFSAAVFIIPQLKTLAGSVMAGAGIFAVAIGFASQQALSNVVGGIFIVIFKPFQINDRLTVRGTMTGIVEDITLRHTVIRNFENQRIIIPNSVISEEILINPDFVNDRICRYIDVGISFDSDIDLAKKIMAEEVERHPFYIDPRNELDIETGVPLVIVRVVSLGEYAVNIRSWAWAKNSPNGFVMSCDLLESIKKRFDKEGVEIPFPHRTMVMKDEVMKLRNVKQTKDYDQTA